MTSARHAIGMFIGLAALAPLARAAPEPTVDLGDVGSYKVFVQPDYNGSPANSAPGLYDKSLTFSVNEDSLIRVDARYAGSYSKYNQNYIANPAVSIFDAAHTLIGSGAMDLSYGSRVCYGDSLLGGGCFVQSGLTFSGPLKAGQYTIQFTGQYMNTYGPGIRIGVADVDGGVPSDYFSAVTPPSPIPEPAVAWTMALGLMALGWLKRHPHRR
ncbi:MAG: hypothetical protein QM742_07320 [Aquabacterium sp.]